MLTDTDKAGLIYRMVATSMRDPERNPLDDMEILLLVDTWAHRVDDPTRAKDDVILGLVHVLAGLLLEGAAASGVQRAEAAATVERLARIVEMGPNA